jgi:hypothetical protein
MTPTATAGLGKANVAKFVKNVVTNEWDPQTSATINQTSATNMVGTTASTASAHWTSYICKHVGGWVWCADRSETCTSQDFNAFVPGCPAGAAEAEASDPIEFEFPSPDSIEFRLSLGDADSVFSFQVIGGEASLLYSCSYFNVWKDGSPLNGEMFSIAIGAAGVVTSPSQLQITCTAWPGLGLSETDLENAADYIRANMIVFPDSSIGWTPREVAVIGGAGPIPAIVLDAPVGISRFEDYFHTAVAINQPGTAAPEALGGNIDAVKASPSPFVRTTNLRFTLSKPADVKVRVYDVSGRLVRTLRTGRLDDGPHEVVWDGRNDTHELVGAGTYFVRAESLGRTLDTKVVRMK